MSLITVVKEGTIGYAIKELALANKLISDQGRTTLDLYQILKDNPDNITIVRDLERLLCELPLTPIDDPIATGEFTGKLFHEQSTRCQHLFFDNEAHRWYDVRYQSLFMNILDKILPNFITTTDWFRTRFYTSKKYITFPYEP